MRLDWDPAKDRANLEKHGVSFDAARDFGWDDALEVEDRRYDYPERRWRALGMIAGRLHAIVYTRRADVIRVISLRRANERERRAYGSP